MKLWQKKYTVDKIIEEFTVGNDRLLDLELAFYDIIGSMAHAKMLHETGLLDENELKNLLTELKEILEEVKEGRFIIEEGVEDVHSQVELLLTKKLGDTGKKIHTGRSRNDQVLLDLKLYMREQVREIVILTEKLFKVLVTLSQRYKDVLMPGYTHFQVAMPSSFGLWFGAYAESLTDDLVILKGAFDVINRNPLGSGAGYGSSFPLKRQMTTDLLGFESMNFNVVYAQMGRGKAEKSLANAMGNFAGTLGKLSSDVCLYMSQNYGFLSFPDELTTGSSIMPHKKNPDAFEIIRGRCNQINSFSGNIDLITANMPSGYHRDFQLLKEGLISSCESLKKCLHMAAFMLEKIRVNPGILEESKYDFLFTVEKVNEMVLAGKNFRDAYVEVSDMIEKGLFIPNKKISHTHEGRIGNLQNEQIELRMNKIVTGFKGQFEIIDKNIAGLIT